MLYNYDWALSANPSSHSIFFILAALGCVLPSLLLGSSPLAILERTLLCSFTIRSFSSWNISINYMRNILTSFYNLESCATKDIHLHRCMVLTSVKPYKQSFPSSLWHASPTPQYLQDACWIWHAGFGVFWVWRNLWVQCWF